MNPNKSQTKVINFVVLSVMFRFLKSNDWRLSSLPRRGFRAQLCEANEATKSINHFEKSLVSTVNLTAVSADATR